MITIEQINAAINQHNADADALDDLARHLRGSVADYVRSQDGKQISKRLYLPLCAAAGLKSELLSNGSTIYRAAEWKADIYAHAYGGPSYRYICGVRVSIGDGGAFRDLPLIPFKDTDKLDAAATVAQFERIAAACDAGAKYERYAASRTEYAADEYNKIQAAAVALLDKLDADTLAAFPGDYYGSVSILCSLGREYHHVLSTLRWENAQ